MTEAREEVHPSSGIITQTGLAWQQKTSGFFLGIFSSSATGDHGFRLRLKLISYLWYIAGRLRVLSCPFYDMETITRLSYVQVNHQQDMLLLLFLQHPFSKYSVPQND